MGYMALRAFSKYSVQGKKFLLVISILNYIVIKSVPVYLSLFIVYDRDEDLGWDPMFYLVFAPFIQVMTYMKGWLI